LGTQGGEGRMKKVRNTRARRTPGPGQPPVWLNESTVGQGGTGPRRKGPGKFGGNSQDRVNQKTNKAAQIMKRKRQKTARREIDPRKRRDQRSVEGEWGWPRNLKRLHLTTGPTITTKTSSTSP